MSSNLRGNWNYPTTIWAGPGRIAELAEACARAGIRRALLVTDEGLTGAPMIKNALADIGVSAEKAEIIGREAAVDPSAGGNPIPVDAAALERIFRAAVSGRLEAVGGAA